MEADLWDVTVSIRPYLDISRRDCVSRNRKYFVLSVALVQIFVAVGPLLSGSFRSVHFDSPDGSEASAGFPLKDGDNLPPSANFSWMPSNPKEGESISFEDTSSDPDNNIVSWLWNFGDGTGSDERNPTQTYGHAGDYEVTLEVTDSGELGHVGRLLTTDKHQQAKPHLFNNLVVWHEISDQDGKERLDIYLYDTTSDMKTQIAPSPNDQFNPRIYGKLIVWLEAKSDSGSSDVFSYDVATNRTTRITNDSFNQYGVDVYKDRVVWLDHSDAVSGPDVYVFNCTTQKKTKITSFPSTQSRPRISGDYVVWEDTRNGNSDIYIYDSINKSETQVTSEPHDQYGAEIWGNRVVWMDMRFGWTDIFMFDILSRETTQITSGDIYDVWPDIFEEKVIWTRALAGEDGGVFMFDIARNKTSQLVPHPPITVFVSIHNNKAVWEQFDKGNESGNHDVYLLEINDSGNQPLSDKKIVKLHVDNVAPTTSVSVIHEGDVYYDFIKVTEGSRIEFEGSFDDPSWLDSHTILWDFGDGETQSGSISSTTGGTHHTLRQVSHTYGDDGSFMVELRVTDDLAGIGRDFIEVEVENVSPTVEVDTSAIALEGLGFAVKARASDPGSDDLTFHWDWGDGTPNAIIKYYNDGANPDPYPSPGGTYPVKVTATVNHTYGDNGPYKMSLTVTDDDGGQVVYSTTVDVDNVAPSIKPIGPFNVDEGESITVTAEATDVGSDDMKFTWKFEFGPTLINIYYNDGIGPDPYPSPDGTFPFSATDAVSHTYGDNGIYDVKVVVEDDDGGETSYTTTITVNNVDPVSSIEAYMFVDFTLRVAGEKWHNVVVTLYEDGVSIGYAEVVRYPGSPDDQSVGLVGVRCNLAKTLSATVQYTPDDDPINGQINGANPVWLILWFEDGSNTTLNHTFNVKHPETWGWNVDINQLLVGHDISFKATAQDPGSDDLTFIWYWGDGSPNSVATYYNNAMGPDPFPSPEVNPMMATDVQRHVYMIGGTYTVKLTVADDDGGTVQRTLILSL